MAIRRGDLVEVTTARGSVERMRALRSAEMGRDFVVVWVCTESDWSGEDPDAAGLPWPAEHVRESAAAAAG